MQAWRPCANPLGSLPALLERHLDAGQQVVMQPVQRVPKIRQPRPHHWHRARLVAA